MEKMRKDPLILRNARVDVGYGLFNTMDAAKAVLPGVSRPYLMLHGMGDKLVPEDSVKSAIALMPRRLRRAARPQSSPCPSDISFGRHHTSRINQPASGC